MGFAITKGDAVDQYTLTTRAGDSFSRPVRLLEDDGSTPVNLTGASVEWALATRGAAEQWADDSHVRITNAAEGRIALRLTPNETREFYGRSWRYEVTVTFADASRLTVLEGVFSVNREAVA